MRKGVVWSSAMAAVIALAIPLAAQQMQKETIDYTALYQLKQEALGNSSQVMKTLSFISDVYGGRLTGSTNAKLAADWSVKALESWGLSNVHLEPWEFGRGWVNERFSANVTSPVTYPLIGAALAWTPGTNGTINADAMIATIANEGDFAKYAGKLKGKIVLLTPARVIAMSTEPLAHRYTDAELAEIAEEPVSGNPRPASGAFQPDIATLREQFRAAREFRPKLMKFLVDEGVAAVFSEGSGDGGTFHAQSGGSYSDNTPAPTQVVLAAEHYNRIYRTIEDGVPVSVELNVQNKFLDGDRNSFDIIAEIPGSDPALADQVVMIGGHFDSWQSGTGATDNGVGSAVMMEVMRVLKASGLKFRRTIRLGLWTGEEEGLLGSRAYVAQHFGDRNTMQLKPEQSKFDVYFNIDNGSGKIRGIYLQGNEAAEPVFKAWMAPFANLGMTTISIQNTGGTDHQSFDAVGLPGFQFIQDPLEYETRTHHTNMDLYDRVQPADLKQMVAIVATFVNQAANRTEMFPRKPLPKPQTGGRGF